ncbi:lysophosphatidylcholine acyltransferase 1 isoform X1 [Dermacentor andersoni]|uniref:lysophosphatidylcholine acyltransferase 1 isoform X1 n=2 Tax=Dermacentor andersoni TaxID=34620 RepID=UPI002155AA44|nr:lysophosphatidylcholine acyltransferase 1-like isoform X1 [Dermacentor andersoni]
MNEADSPAGERPIFDASKFPLGDAKILPDYTQLKAPDDIDNMTSQLIDGSYSPTKDVMPNPFHYRIHLTRADKIKVALMSVFVVPVRIVLIIFFLLLTWLGCYLGQLGLSHKDRTGKPLTGFRRAIQSASRECVLMCVRSAGFVLRTVGRAAPAHEAPILVAAPHSSFFDTVAAMHGNPVPSAVVRSKSKGMFFLGTILNFTQPVYVKRSDPNSRQNTVREITRRATSKEPWSQVIIFPEGTCTNRSCLITFKLGAFVPGVPVQPVLIRYPNELNTLIWTWDGPSAFETLWLTLCQLRTHMEIEYLPVYVPSEREKKDPKLYAENVRCLMAKALRIPLSSYSYDDLKQTDVEDSARVKTVVCNRLQQLISRNCIQFRDMSDVILKVKAAIKNRESSRVSFLEFVAILGVPSDHISKNMFEALDIDQTRKVDLRAVLAAFWLVHKSERHQTEKAFEAFCEGSSGIRLEDFAQLIWILLALPKSAAMSMFQKIDTAALGQINFEDFKEFISMTKWADILASPLGNSDLRDGNKCVPSKEE